MGMFGFVLGLSAGIYITKRTIMKNQQQQQVSLNNVSEEEKQSMWQQYLNQKKMETNSQALLNRQEDSDDNHSLLSLSREYITRIRNENFPIIHAQEKSNIDSLNSKTTIEKD